MDFMHRSIIRLAAKEKKFAEPNFWSPARRASLLVIVFLHHDADETVAAFAKIPDHVHQPLATITVVEQRRVKAD
jgi:hypothetical protein